MSQIIAKKQLTSFRTTACPSLAPELQQLRCVHAHDVKKGIFFDDESYIVRNGAEPNSVPKARKDLSSVTLLIRLVGIG
jgi:hypothetical protein